MANFSHQKHVFDASMTILLFLKISSSERLGLFPCSNLALQNPTPLDTSPKRHASYDEDYGRDRKHAQDDCSLGQVGESREEHAHKLRLLQPHAESGDSSQQEHEHHEPSENNR